MAEDSPLVSVLVPCRNEVNHIERCVEQLLNLIPPAGGFEIIIADGCSDDGTAEVLGRLAQQDSRISIVTNLRRTTPCGLNLAIHTARGQILVRADAHTDYAQDYLVRCVEALQRTGADNVGGAARTKAVGYRQRAIAAAYHSAFAVGGARFHNIEFEGFVDTIPYGCWPRATFERFGYFDEELVRNQDDEHNLRIERGGGKVYQARDIRSWYYPRSSFWALFRQYRQYGYWKVRVIQKHKLPASIRHLVPAGFVMTLGALASLATLSFFGLTSVRPTAWLLEGLLLLYFGTSIAASVIAVAKSRWDLFPMLPFVFAIYHIGYGLGFLRGVLDFVIRRKSGSEWAMELTRVRG